MTIFYRRSGERVAKWKVQASQQAFANSYRTGLGVAGPGSRAINLRLADRIASMTLTEYCSYTGGFTYKTDSEQHRT